MMQHIKNFKPYMGQHQDKELPTVKFFSEIKAVFPCADIKIAERLSTVESSFSVTNNMLSAVKDITVIKDILKLVPNRDSIKLDLQNDSNDILCLNSLQTDEFNYSTFVEGLLPEDNIEIIIKIDKTVADERYSIYNYESFVIDLLSRPLTEIMVWFSKLLSERESLLFEVFDSDVFFSTRTIAFASDVTAMFKPTVNRVQRLNACKEASYFYNMDSYEILPDDFIMQGIVRTSNPLQLLFGKLATILSIAYVSSSSSITESKINVQINGQRSINYDLSITDILEDDKWQSIYTWIFTEGNSTDKALIAHNVISLHCKFETLLNLDDTVFDAIRTNYNLYLRNNVKQYLDMKRDIAKFIQNIVSQIGDCALSILGKFKNNLFAMAGFLFTVVLTRIGSIQKWEDIFTKHTLYLIEIFVLGSLVYMVICIFETLFKLSKTKKGYEELKDNYRDVLSEVEIVEAFKDDKLLKDTEKTTQMGIIGWTIAWGILLILAIVIIECLTTNHGIMVWLWNRVFFLFCS
jgi:hypothetical protein